MDSYIYTNSDFKIIYSRLTNEQGNPLSLASVDEFRLRIVESNVNDNLAIALNEDDDGARYVRAQTRSELSIQILASDYDFAAGREYFYQLFLVSGEIITAMPMRRFQAIRGLDPTASEGGGGISSQGQA